LPSLHEILNDLQFVTGELAILALFITGAAMVLLPDWRASLLALLGQYLMAGLILSRLVLPEVALVKVLVGALVCPMLYLAARQAGWGRRYRSVQDRQRQEVFPGGFAFRLLAMTLITLLTMALSRSYPLPAISPAVGLASYWLMLHGLLILILSEEPLKAGQGLLMGIIGFELLYASIERSLAMVWMWAVINLLVTLAIAYLAVVRGAGGAAGDL
jgi:hypothetical protein